MFYRDIQLKLAQDIIYFFLAVFLSTLFLAVTAKGQQDLNARILKSFPSPGTSPQDLAWDGNYIWVADDSTDTIYNLYPSDGSVILTLPTPGPESRGLTWAGTYLWCSDSDSSRIFKLSSSDGLDWGGMNYISNHISY